MGKAYNQSQRDHVKSLLEAGRDEDGIEKETGVSDRTIRRWKMELEKTGRIGKPPESRTGRHRVLNPEVEAALFEHVKDKPDMSVDDMLWWLYETYKIVVGTRTIRRVFERKGEAGPRFKKGKESSGPPPPRTGDEADDTMEDQTPVQPSDPKYQSPYAPLNIMAPPPDQTELNLAQALSNANTYPAPPPHMPMDLNDDLLEDEETLQLELQRIELQKREVEVKLKMRRLQQGRAPQAPGNARRATTTTPSSLYKPSSKPEPSGPKRDSRSKKKIEESKRRTAERQERMLKDLERRSRRREHLTAEWVQSKDIWPLRAQGMLADLMHQCMCYTFSQNNVEAFEMMYRELYGLVDLQAGDWDSRIHDDMLRERMKRKMGQLRTKMQKTGEIVGRPDGYGGWQKADNYTGEQAGQMLGGDENDNDHPHHDPAMQAQAGALAPSQQQQQAEEAMHYEPVPDPTQTGMQHGTPFYGNPPMMHHQPPPGYAMDPHSGMLPYGQVPQQPSMHDNGMFSG